MGDCPSCGRYVGPYDACPYCGAALSGRTPIRRLKVAALIMALGGLLLLWLLATQTDVPSVEIGQANAMMNLAYVRVQGLVTRPPAYDPETGYFSFWLADETGELHVAAYRNETRALIDQGHTPALGDRVSVEGTLRVREDFISLTVNVPERLEVSRATPVTRSIGAITAADEFTWVQVRGQLRAVRVPYPGLTLIGLRDSTGEIDLAVTEVITDLSGPLPPLAIGQTVQVVAPVSLYKQTPQLSLAHVDDLTLLEAPLLVAPASPMGQIDAGQVGDWVTISGQVTGVDPFSAGVKCALDDGSGQVTLLLWQNVYEQLTDPDALAVGAMLRAQGQVSEYKGELEIIPELPADVAVLTAAPLPALAAASKPSATAPPNPSTLTATSRPTAIPTTPASTRPSTPTHTPTPTHAHTHTPTPTPPHTPPPAIGDLDASRQGTQVTVIGQVVDTASFSQGFKFTLDDGSGQIVLLMWQDVYQDCWDAPGLNVGATVRASGEVGQFEGALQIEPRLGGDVKVTAGGGSFAPQVDISAINAHLGGRAMIVGQILRVEGTDSGVKLFVGDDTGETLVYVWNNVLAQIADNQALGVPGTRVRVVGVVQEYRGNLELVPVLPYDVEILQ